MTTAWIHDHEKSTKQAVQIFQSEKHQQIEETLQFELQPNSW